MNFVSFKGDVCCWHCQACHPYERLLDEHTCEDCGEGRWPHDNKTECFDLEQKVSYESVNICFCIQFMNTSVLR